MATKCELALLVENVNLLIPMIRLASEYDAKPGLAPPLVIIEDIWKLFKSIWKKTCRRKQEDLEALMTRDIEMLELFEKDCLHEYTTLQNSSMEMINDMRLSKLEENVNKIVKLLEEPEMLHQNRNIQEFSELGDQSKPYRNAHLSSKILTAKIRSQSARARESFAILERKIETVNEETKSSLEVIEKSMSAIQHALGHKHKKHRRKSKH